MNYREKILPHLKQIAAAVLFTICLSAGVAGYILIKPREPLRVVFPSSSGPVLYDHRLHTAADGPALECSECHHNYKKEDKQPVEMACRQCHYYGKTPPSACKDNTPHPRCIGVSCLKCHDGESCEYCHKKR